MFFQYVLILIMTIMKIVEEYNLPPSQTMTIPYWPVTIWGS
jgi:hypothetical protein